MLMRKVVASRKRYGLANEWNRAQPIAEPEKVTRTKDEHDLLTFLCAGRGFIDAYEKKPGKEAKRDASVGTKSGVPTIFSSCLSLTELYHILSPKCFLDGQCRHSATHVVRRVAKF